METTSLRGFPMGDDNVIMFPHNKNNTPPMTLEDVQESVDAIRSIRIDECLDALVTTFIDGMMVSGFDIEDEDNNKDIALVASAIRSLMLKTLGLPHPFQDIAQHAFIDHGDGYVSLNTGSELSTEEESNP